MAALLGGIASQEVIKLITKQYVIVSDSVIFNGLNGTSLSFEL